MRKKKLIYNTVTSVLNQLVTMIYGFVLPKLFLSNFGSDMNGLISSITQFLGFIALMELGVGAVVQSALYKPIAEEDQAQISRIVISAERFFKRVAMLFSIYVVVLLIAYPFVTINKYDFWFTFSIILILSVNSFAQYYFGMPYQILLNAEQKSYVHLLLKIGAYTLNLIVATLLIKAGAGIQIVEICATAIFVMRPLLLSWYVKRHYQIDRNVVIDKEPIEQKWNGLAQHVATVVRNNTDVVVLTILTTLKNVSIYSVYHNITTGVTNIVTSFTTGIQALLGNMYAKEESELLDRTFSTFEWTIHTVVTMVFTCAGILVLPFVTVYTKGVNDANYILPLFSSVLMMAQAAYCYRLPYNIMVMAAGHYRQTQTSAIIEMILNIIISVLLVFKFDIVGVAVGTLIAMAYRTIYFVYYLSKNILYRSPIIFVKQVIVDVMICILTIIACHSIEMYGTSYMAWFVMAIKVALISLGVSLGVNFIFSHNMLKEGIKMLKSKF